MLQRIARFKQWLGYASGWFGMLAMPLLIVDLLQKKLTLIHVEVPFILLAIICTVLLLIFGYVCERIGLIKAENNYNYSQQEHLQRDLERKIK